MMTVNNIRVDISGEIGVGYLYTYMSFVGTKNEISNNEVIDLIHKVTRVRKYVLRRMIKDFSGAEYSMSTHGGSLSIKRG